MWPWLMILAGTLIIIGALVARHRMMRDYRARLAESEAAKQDTSSTTLAMLLARDEPVARDEVAAPLERTSVQPVQPEQPEQPTGQIATPPPAATPVPTAAPKAPPLFADRPLGHRLSTAPTIRVRAQDVPLQDWLRYYADGNAWSGVIQSVSDRVSGDRELQPYVGSMDRATLQRHVMSTLMMLTGEGVTVGAVRRLAQAHLEFVQAGGDPITEETWDRLAATLGNAMREHGVPEFAVQGLEHTAAPLRSVIVPRDRA